MRKRRSCSVASPPRAGGEPGTELIAKRIVDVFDDRNGRVNRVEQPPQEIRGWTVAAMVAIEHSPASWERR